MFFFMLYVGLQSSSQNIGKIDGEKYDIVAKSYIIATFDCYLKVDNGIPYRFITAVEKGSIRADFSNLEAFARSIYKESNTIVPLIGDLAVYNCYFEMFGISRNVSNAAARFFNDNPLDDTRQRIVLNLTEENAEVVCIYNKVTGFFFETPFNEDGYKDTESPPYGVDVEKVIVPVSIISYTPLSNFRVLPKE